MSGHYGDVQDVLELSNRKPEDFNLESQELLEQLVEKLLTKLTSHVNTRLVQGEIEPDDYRYPAICDIAERKVLDMMSIVQQAQSGDTVSIDDLSVHIINTTEAISDLDEELRSFQSRRIHLSW